MEKHQAELELQDIMLPEEDGLQIIKKLRAAPETRRLPVILLTAKNSEFDRVIGLAMLKELHINVSMKSLGALKDGLAGIGEGDLGEAAFGRIVNHPALRELPFILETPNDLAGYAREIARLRELRVE